MMAAPSPTVDPIAHSSDWLYFKLGGYNSPGSIPKDGLKGFERKTGWDEKKGKGTQGATLTLTSAPPVKGTITLQLISSADFLAWDIFVLNVLSINPTQQQAAGLAIYHPAFASIGLTTVVIAHYTKPEHKGKGMYHVQIELIEWQSPPPKNVASTVSATKQDSSTDAPSPPPDSPEVAALKQQVKQAQAANQAP